MKGSRKGTVMGTSIHKHVSGENSPMNFLGAAAGFAAGRLMGRRKDEGPQELLEGTGKTVEKVTGYKVSGGEGEPEGAGDMPSVDDEVIDEGMAID